MLLLSESEGAHIKFVHRTGVVGWGEVEVLNCPPPEKTPSTFLKSFLLSIQYLSDSRLKNYGLHIADSIFTIK